MGINRGQCKGWGTKLMVFHDNNKHGIFRGDNINIKEKSVPLCIHWKDSFWTECWTFKIFEYHVFRLPRVAISCWIGLKLAIDWRRDKQSVTLTTLVTTTIGIVIKVIVAETNHHEPHLKILELWPIWSLTRWSQLWMWSQLTTPCDQHGWKKQRLGLGFRGWVTGHDKSTTINHSDEPPHWPRGYPWMTLTRWWGT